MRFVTRKRKSGYIYVTDLAKFLTCPYYFLREKVGGRKYTEAMKKGAELHRKRYIDHRIGAIEIALEEAVKLSWEEKVVGVEIWVDDGEVGGYIDRIEIEEGKAKIIEYKSTQRSALWRASKLQAVLYGALVYPHVEEVVVEVRTFDENIFFRKKIDNKVLESVEEGKELFKKSLLLGSVPRFPGVHCRYCPFKTVCPIFKSSSPFVMGVSEVAGDGRVQL